MTPDAIALSNLPYRFFTFDNFLKTQAELGLRQADLFGGSPHILIDAYGYDGVHDIRRSLEQYGIRARAFFPEFISMRYTSGITDMPPEKSAHYLENCMRFAAELDISDVVMPLNGYYLNLSGSEVDEQAERSLRMLDGLAGRYGLRLHILPHYADATCAVRTLPDMRDRVCRHGFSNIRPALDISSLYESGECIADWFSEIGTDISYVNLTSTKYDGQRHAFGDGYLNPLEVWDALQSREYSGMLGCHYLVREYLLCPAKTDGQLLAILREVSALCAGEAHEPEVS